ncbi:MULTISPECIES: aliphatic sulfonate ABC transporter permease SsuC [Polaromonas]|mgnify:CR=1 FL=1|uniref:Aliphatic sulfonate ABC transporter permease SsuC n=1 Tax=Polaromonas aquatica TaxID=332657 RepID=A0ABW1TUT6_9BURK
MISRKTVSLGLPWILPVLVIVVWQVAAQMGALPSRILPAPSAVARAAGALIASGELWIHLAASFRRAGIGFAVGGSIGFGLGLLTGTSRLAEQLLDSTIQMIRNIPHLALIPLVIIWFGVGEPGKLFLVSLGVMFPLYINTYHGMRSVDKGLIEMGRVYGLTRWGLFREVMLPGAMSSILVGVRFSLGFMWLTLIVAETIAANSGIGKMAMDAREFMQTDVVVVAILLYALLGKLADVLARILEHRWLRWNMEKKQ